MCLRLNRKCVPAHVTISLPHFRSSKDQEMAERLLGNNDDARRELAGVISNENRHYLFKEYVPALKSREPYDLQYNLDIVYIGIDPSGGGASSDYAISSIAFENDRWILLGIDRSSGADHNLIWQMLTNHVMKLREHSKTKQALFLFFIESNMSYIESNRLRELFETPRFQPTYVESRDKSKQMRAGIITSEESKIAMASDLKQVLSDGKLSYWRDMITQLDSKDQAKAELESQLIAYRRDARPSPDPARTRPIVTYSGKGAGNARDDQCMALQITLNEARKKRESAEFRDLCRQRHLRY